MTIKTDRKAKKRGSLLATLQSSSPGQSFFIDLMPKVVTTYAAIYGYKLQTEVVLCLSGIRAKEQKVTRITKVTILENTKP